MKKDNKITEDDFDLEEVSDDKIFMELYAGGDEDSNRIRTKATSTNYACYLSAGCASIIVSLSSLASASDPANTYTELGCC
jgi:hypothetical protein